MNRHRSKRKLIAITIFFIFLIGFVSGCGMSTISKLTFQEVKYQKMGWISVRENDPSAVLGYQRLQDEMKVSPDIRNYVAAKGLPDYLKITTDLFFRKLELIYCREGIVYQFSSIYPRYFKHKMTFRDYAGQLPSCPSAITRASLNDLTENVEIPRIPSGRVTSEPDQEVSSGVSLVGKWEAQLSDNAYHMWVAWNEEKNIYEGILTKQGSISQDVGFSIGELVWKATPTDNLNVMIEQQKLRWGNNGVSTKYEWLNGKMYLDRSSRDELVTSKNRFHRVQESQYSAEAYNNRAKTYGKKRQIDNASSEEYPLKKLSDNMRNSIWHIDFTEVNGKPKPTSSISYVDRESIPNISDIGAALSPNSSWFAVVEVHDKEMALVLKSGDKTAQQNTLFKPAEGERLCAWPAWSPGGDKIAIIHIQPDKKRKLFSHNIIIADINGSWISKHKLPEGIVNFPVAMAPFNKFSWSPDGKKILISWDKAGILNVDTGRFIKLSDSPIIAEWAPDSNSVYYFGMEYVPRNRRLKDFYKRDLDSTKPLKLANKSRYKRIGLRHSWCCTYGHLNLSPSGSKMIFAGGSNNKMEDVIRIYTIERNKPIDIFKPSQKLPIDAVIISTQWAPDEKNIAILAVRAKPSMELTVEILSLETQKMKTVTKIDLPRNVSDIEIIDLIVMVKSLGWTR